MEWRRRAVVVAASVMMSGCWWQPGFGPDHARHDPYEKALRAATVAHLAEHWSLQVEGSLSEPVSDGHHVFVSRSAPGVAQVMAVDPVTGTVAWSRDLPGLASTAPLPPVALAGGDLWAGACGALHRLDPRTGTIKSSTPLAYPTTAITSAEDLVAWIDSPRCARSDSATGLARLVVADPRTRTVRWVSNLARGATTAAPTIADGRIYARLGGEIQAFAAQGCGARTCAPVWSISARTVPPGPVVATGGRVFVPTSTIAADDGDPTEPYTGTSTVQVLDAATGNELWRAERGWRSFQQPRPGSLAVSDSTVYATGLQPDARTADVPSLQAYKVGGCGRPTCDPTWTAPVDAAAEPAVAGDVVVVPTTYSLKTFAVGGCGARNCEPVATTPGTFSAPDTMVVSDGQVYVVETDDQGSADATGTLHAFGLQKTNDTP